MFEAMRRNMKLIMWITAGSFVLLIFLAWGLEFQGLGGKASRQPGVIGSVNGEPILERVYQDRVMQARTNFQQQRGQTPDEGTDVQIRNQAWDALVQEMLLNQEIRRLKLEASDQEVLEAIRNQPLPAVMQAPDFQTNGQFDYNKYLAALNDPNRDWLPLEMYYREDVPKQKLQQIVMASAKVSDADVRRQFEAENTKARVAYAFVPAQRFTVDPASISESDARAYYDAHTDDYRADDQAWVQYVQIPKAPTISDTLAARDLIQQAAKELTDGESFDVIVSAYSEALPQMRGGEQGVYLTRDQVHPPVLAEAAFTLPVGQVSPILTEPGGFHMIRVEDRRMNGEKEEVKIADVFIPISLSSETVTAVQDKAVAVANATKEDGNFTAAAQKEELEVKQAGPFGRTSSVPLVGQVPGFLDWAFGSNAGAVHMFEDRDAWYVAHILKRLPAGLQPYEEIKDRVRNDAVLSKQIEQAKQAAQSILDAAKGGTPLEQAAKIDPEATFDRTDEFAKRSFPRGLGNDPTIFAHVFTAPIGVVPEVVTTKRGAYVLEVLSRTAPDESLFASQKDTIRRQLLQMKRREIVNRWMEDLRARAEIQDFRGDNAI
ncbi:MAG: SurA N-terminal domain-containing protein [Candidatus Eisenbacteria bacterium]|nr:SurA N-terminal domain-containing protein [Candidatus Eisenbacteria bacterium]